jgi:hypothetical protein
MRVKGVQTPRSGERGYEGGGFCATGRRLSSGSLAAVIDVGTSFEPVVAETPGIRASGRMLLRKNPFCRIVLFLAPCLLTMYFGFRLPRPSGPVHRRIGAAEATFDRKRRCFRFFLSFAAWRSLALRLLRSAANGNPFRKEPAC